MNAASPLREDLLHLSPEALTHLANAGIVKRAMRELAGGDRPTLEVDAAAQLTARFADGTECRWPVGIALPNVRCSCGAAGICRHRIIAALAYREAAAEAPREVDTAAGDPGGEHVEDAANPVLAPRPVYEASDASLRELLAPAVWAQALALREAGLSIELRPRGDGEPCDTARLPSATVRYWGGAALATARCDCIRATACEHVALGLWAFQAVPEGQRGRAATVRLSGRPEDHATTAASASASIPEAATARPIATRGTEDRAAVLPRGPFEQLAQALMRHGVSDGASTLAQPLSLARSAAGAGAGAVGASAASRTAGVVTGAKATKTGSTGHAATWLLGVLDDMETWSDAYARRSTRYDAADGVDLLGELALRLAAGAQPGRAGEAWGTGQPGEVELDRLRLTCLGLRTRRDGESRRSELVLADLDTGTRLLLRHDWQVPDARAVDEAMLRATERVAPGVMLDALGHGQLLSRQAVRRPDGSVRLARHRADRNQLLPQSADWGTLLASPLRIEDLGLLRRERALHPHPDLVPRQAARRFVVFTPRDWGTPFYDAHEQTVASVLRDADGQALLIRRAHERHVPQALEAIAQALTAPDAAPRHVAGMLSWRQGLPELEIWAIAGTRLTVPDLAAPTGGWLAPLPLGHVPLADTEADAAAGLDGPRALRTLLATLLHHGRRRLPPAWRHEALALRRRLEQTGWRALGDALAVLLETLDAEEGGLPASGAALLRLTGLMRLHADMADVAAVDA